MEIRDGLYQLWHRIQKRQVTLQLHEVAVKGWQALIFGGRSRSAPRPRLSCILFNAQTPWPGTLTSEANQGSQFEVPLSQSRPISQI